MQCSQTLSIISSMDWERTIGAMKLHQHFEFGPAWQDPFSFCRIQLALHTVYMAPGVKYLFTTDSKVNIERFHMYTVSRASCIWQNENGSWEAGPNSKCW